MKDQYFKVKKDKLEYLGNRYFRFNYDSEKVLQVCLATGDVKKGKSNTFGIYLIHKVTLFSNYMGMNYLEPCSKKEFENKFNTVVKILK